MTQQTVRSRTRADQEVAISRGHLNRETHVRHRDYSPTLGRFIERDPIGFEAGDGNWYRFVANGPTGKTDATGLLAPNIGKGRGDYHYTWHEVHFRAGSAAGCDRLRNKIYDDLKSFRFFNGGSNWEATVRIDGNIAYFDAQGLYGSGSDRIGNADEAPVSLAFFDARFLVVATTLEGHLLDGKRYWTVFVDKGPFCQCDVSIATWAYERKVGIVMTCPHE
jgi:RHS repeat-associated protein